MQDKPQSINGTAEAIGQYVDVQRVKNETKTKVLNSSVTRSMN